MTGLVADQLVAVLARAHVADRQVDALLVAASADVRGSIRGLEAVDVDGALVDAAEAPGLVLPVAAIVATVTDLRFKLKVLVLVSQEPIL